MPVIDLYIADEEYAILLARSEKPGTRNVGGQIRELICKELFPIEEIVEKSNIEAEVNTKLGYVTIYDWEKADMVVFSGTLVNAVEFLLRRQYPDHNFTLRRQYPDHNFTLKEEGPEPRHR